MSRVQSRRTTKSKGRLVSGYFEQEGGLSCLEESSASLAR